MKKNFWNSDRVISFSAILISVMTLVVLVYQTNIMREQQRLSVLPYLSMNNSGTGTSNYSFMLYNNGIGPAFVEAVKVIHKGKEYEMDIPSFLNKYIPKLDSINNLYHSNVYAGMLIPAGMELPVLQIDNSKEDADKLFALFKELSKEGFDFELTYKSIYNERWVLRGNTPEKLD